MTTTPHTATPNLPSEHARSSSQFIVCPAPSPTHKLRATWPDGRHETFPCRAGDTELSRTMTRRQVETVVSFVMRSALEGCVHSWIADESARKFGVRAELVRGLLAV